MSLKNHPRKRMLPIPTLQVSQEPTVARPRKPTIELPPHVNVVRVRGRPYFYLHLGRGTKSAKKPIRLPDDPRSPEFWAVYRHAMNKPEPRQSANAVDALIAAYRAAPEWHQLADATRTNWELYLKRIHDAWGRLEVRGIEPRHVLALRDKLRCHSSRCEQSPSLPVLNAIVVSPTGLAG